MNLKQFKKHVNNIDEKFDNLEIRYCGIVAKDLDNGERIELMDVNGYDDDMKEIPSDLNLEFRELRKTMKCDNGDDLIGILKEEGFDDAIGQVKIVFENERGFAKKLIRKEYICDDKARILDINDVTKEE